MMTVIFYVSLINTYKSLLQYIYIYILETNFLIFFNLVTGGMGDYKQEVCILCIRKGSAIQRGR